MRKIAFYLLMLLCAVMTATPADAKKKKAPKEKDMGAYLMVYHKDADHGLHFALSYDGENWKALNGDKPVIAGDTIAEQKGIRDPHIFRAPNGTFYVAMTDLHIFAKRQDTETPNGSATGRSTGGATTAPSC